MRGKMKFAHYEGFLVPRFMRSEAVASIDRLADEKRLREVAEARRKAEREAEAKNQAKEWERIKAEARVIEEAKRAEEEAKRAEEAASVEMEAVALAVRELTPNQMHDRTQIIVPAMDTEREQEDIILEEAIPFIDDFEGINEEL